MGVGGVLVWRGPVGELSLSERELLSLEFGYRLSSLGGLYSVDTSISTTV